MHLKTALGIAIPYAMQDRDAMAEAYGRQGKEAEAAAAARKDLRALVGVSPSTFTAGQRETARMALLWAEQHLDGYIDAIKDSEPREKKTAVRQRHQLRRVRFQHFGRTLGEELCKRAVAVDAMEYAIAKSPQAPAGKQEAAS